MKKSNNQEKHPLFGALKTILNTMDAYLYVSDIQTDEILFINDRMKEHYNLSGDPVGGICWKTLQAGFEKRCDFCPVPKLIDDPDMPVAWEERCTLTGRYYKNIDRIIEWVDGRRAHLRHSMDITDIKLAEDSLNKRLEQQELMSAISQVFTSMQDTSELIYQALKKSGEFMGVDQSFLSKYRQDEGYLDCLYEWCGKGGQPFIGSKSKWPITPDMEIYRNLMEKGFAAVSDYSKLTHPNFGAIEGHGMQAFLNFSIEVSGELWGILGFILNKRTYVWEESDIHLGKLIAGIFSGAIRRNIAEENLLKAKETAEEASRAKGEFLSSMSHEIRTPMNAIIGMTQMAKDSDDIKKIKYCLDRVDSASKHLLGIINDILDMSKIEANKLDLSPAEFDFERMLINITGVVNSRIEEKNQNLIVSIDKNIPSVLVGDETRLSQVIANLLSNSVKFAPDGGAISLNIRSVDVTDGISTLLFEVVDNGIGISKEQQARLFSPFEQADGGMARKYGGTGLGLSISKKIVQLMEGQIWVDSELGQGAKFSFTVKMRDGKNLPRTAVNKDGIRILVVEGNPKSRDYFMRLTSELGLECDVVGSEIAALDMIKKNGKESYGIFIIDCVTMGLDGIALTKRIKHINRNNKVIIVLPAANWDNIEKDAVAAGADRFIFNPVFPSTLTDAVNSVMGLEAETKNGHDDTSSYDFKGNTILIAEDIDINREIVCALLEDTKISIDFAADGAEAISIFGNNAGKYDLILMDIQMPIIDGYEATRKIRDMDNAWAKDIPIIAMTANVFREDIEKCMREGMNDHIGKPLDAQDLLYKLDKYLSLRVKRALPLAPDRNEPRMYPRITKWLA